MKKLIVTLLVVILIIAGAYFIEKGRDKDDDGNLKSVTVGNEYKATTTAVWNGLNTSYLVDKGWGTLGSVIITKAGDVQFYLLDATNTPLLIDDFATTSKLLVDFPASAAAGTYAFDVIYNDGLYFYVLAGVNGTSTITYR